MNFSLRDFSILVRSNNPDIIEVAAINIAIYANQDGGLSLMQKECQPCQFAEKEELDKDTASFLSALGQSIIAQKTRASARRALLQAIRCLLARSFVDAEGIPGSESSSVSRGFQQCISSVFLETGLVDSLCAVIGSFDPAAHAPEELEHCCVSLSLLAKDSVRICMRIVSRGLVLRLGGLLSTSVDCRDSSLAPQMKEDPLSAGLRQLGKLNQNTFMAVCTLLISVTQASSEAVGDLLQSQAVPMLIQLIILGLPPGTEPQPEARSEGEAHVVCAHDWQLAECAAKVLLNCLVVRAEPTEQQIMCIPGLAEDILCLIDQELAPFASKSLQYFGVFVIEKTLSRNASFKSIKEPGLSAFQKQSSNNPVKLKKDAKNTKEIASKPVPGKTKIKPNTVKSLLPKAREALKKKKRASQDSSSVPKQAEVFNLGLCLFRSGALSSLVWLLHHRDAQIQATACAAISAVIETFQDSHSSWVHSFIEQGCVAVLKLSTRYTLLRSKQLCNSILHQIHVHITLTAPSRLQLFSVITTPGNSELRLNSATALVVLALHCTDPALMNDFIKGGLLAVIEMMNAPASFPKVFQWIKAAVSLAADVEKPTGGFPNAAGHSRQLSGNDAEPCEDVMVVISDETGISKNIKMTCPSMQVIKSASEVLYKSLCQNHRDSAGERQLPSLKGRYQVWEELMSHIGAPHTFQRAKKTYTTDFKIELLQLSYTYQLCDLHQMYCEELDQCLSPSTVIKIFEVALHCKSVWLCYKCWKCLELCLEDFFSQKDKRVGVGHSKHLLETKNKRTITEIVHIFLASLFKIKDELLK